VAVVTGASSGIGLEAAKVLAGQGWHVIAQGRDPARSEVARAELESAAKQGGGRVDMVAADLAEMSDTARLAEQIAGLTDRVHVLLNNAGGVRAERVESREGNEATFAGNHLGHFLLTGRLLPQLRKAAAESPAGTVRVVNTTSDGHAMGGPLNFHDLQGKQNWSMGKAYCHAKLCNVLFTRVLAKRLEGEGIAANAQHPGVVASNFVNHADEGMRAYINSLESITPRDAGEALAWLAADPDAAGISGQYFEGRKRAVAGQDALDDDSAERLWSESERLVAEAGF
jgi:NAD(P)-dependent dehydrogenase (short-subunit alcohol dehydrogenase family)